MYTIHTGDAIDELRKMPDQSAHCVVTSPPYWGLRDYGADGQLGLESTPDEYVANLVAVGRELWRVLRDDGTLWLNLGDSYNGSGGAGGDYGAGGLKEGQPRYPGRNVDSLKPKDLCGIPWRVAFALQADGCADQRAMQIIDRMRHELFLAYDGKPIPDRVADALATLDYEYREAKGNSWWLRSDLIWHKPNPMPESVTDRPTKSHEYIFLLTKSARYYYDADAIAEASADPVGSAKRYKSPFFVGPKHESGGYSAEGATHTGGHKVFSGTRNKRSVWTVATQPYSGAHFATYPPKLIEPCILAGCPVGGTVLDPFAGSGTTLQVAVAHNRHAVGIELNPDNVELIHERMGKTQIRLAI